MDELRRAALERLERVAATDWHDTTNVKVKIGDLRIVLADLIRADLNARPDPPPSAERSEPGAEGLREANTEAGAYIEDDPVAWEAFCEALNRYHDYLPSLKERFGDDAIKIVAGSMLAFLADQHEVFVESQQGSHSTDRLSKSVSSYQVVERLDRLGNRADGTRDRLAHPGEGE
jgi:hypothetical protein